MTKRQRRVERVVHTFYRLFVVWGWLCIMIYSISLWRYRQGQRADYEYVREARELASKQLVDYHKVETDKKEYKIGEQVGFYSFREVKPLITVYPVELLFEDSFFCDLKSDGRWMRLYSQLKTSNSNPEGTSWVVKVWPRSVPVEKIPKSESTCYGRHIIKVCPYVEWVPCKPQTIISGPFNIVE